MYSSENNVSTPEKKKRKVEKSTYLKKKRNNIEKHSPEGELNWIPRIKEKIQELNNS